MISIEEAQQLMERLIALRIKCKTNADANDHKEYRKHEQLCIEKFRYLITMRTDRYKSFFNYDDLNQEGYVALIKAMSTYDMGRGNFFYWAHRYIETRIYRQANNHSVIRFPMDFAKKNTPHKENALPLMVEESPSPEGDMELSETKQSVVNAIGTLSKKRAKIIRMAFGMIDGQPVSVNKICKQMKISRPVCLSVIDKAIGKLKENIKI